MRFSLLDRSPRARSGLAAIVALTAIAVAGCGGSATKQDVVARANAICASAVRAARALPSPAGGANSPAALTAYLRQLLPIVDHEASSTRALPRPSQDRQILNRYVAAVSLSDEQFHALDTAAQHDSTAGVSQALAALRANPATTLARQYGLVQCASAAGTEVS